MTNKSLAKKIAQQWDYNLMIGDLSFLDLSSNSNQQIKPYINEYKLNQNVSDKAKRIYDYRIKNKKLTESKFLPLFR